MSQILAFAAQARPESQFEDSASEAAITRLLDGGDLDRDEARTLFSRIVEGSLSEPLMAAAFVALRVKGETVDELIGAGEALRAAARPFPSPATLFADSCGTGGDFSGSINVSTAAAFVAAACGLPVVKHGNRSFTSKCGSADVLEALGARLDLTPLESRDILDQTGFCFRKQKPVWSRMSRDSSGVRSSLAPSASSTSAEPHFEVNERLPCLTTGRPHAAATNAAAVDTLIDPEKSPPVPQL